MKIRMQFNGSEVRLNGPVEALRDIVDACNRCFRTRVYDTEYEEVAITRQRVVERGGYLFISDDGPMVARRLSDLNAELKRVEEQPEDCS